MDDPAAEGGYYAIGNAGSNGVTSFAVLKVLVVDDQGVHVRGFAGRYPSLPLDIDPDSLMSEVGHLPLGAMLFNDWNPVLLSRGSVSERELEGYRIWQGGGGYWGTEDFRPSYEELLFNVRALIE